MTRNITDIIIYPIKSLGGVALQMANLTPRGLEHDRRWMLVNGDNHFLTIRQHPDFLFFFLRQIKQGFEVTKKGSDDTLQIPFAINSGSSIKVKIWNDEVEAIEAESTYHDWFTRQMGFNCKLVYMPDRASRRVQPEWVKNEEHVSFADAYPYSILGRSSLADLNSKMSESVTIQRFRPSLVYSGGEAYEEFLWKDIEIGVGKLQCIKPVTRCIVTTMNPETTEKGKDPLKTLFRQRINEKMVFAQNAILSKAAQINVGDNIVINSVKQSPYEPL
jgi:uncharacterized protein